MLGGSASALDITLQNDGQVSGTGWYGAHENNETEPGTQTGQRWDLENLFLNGNQLTLRGGFDYLNGVNVGTRTIRQGDFLIDINGDAVTPWTSASGPNNLNSTFHYDYAIHFDLTGNTLQYRILDLNSGSTFDVVTDIHASNPWRVSDNSSIDGSSSTGIATVTGFSDAEGAHYDLTVDLALGGYDDLIDALATSGGLVHYSIECGNDVILGKINPSNTGIGVADGGMTLALLGVTLSGLAFYRRKTASQKA